MKKCVNGNCSIKSKCALYHQAQNMDEARGSDGKFARHSCKKGKCEHFVERKPKNNVIDRSIGYYQDPYMPDHESAF